MITGFIKLVGLFVVAFNIQAEEISSSVISPILESGPVNLGSIFQVIFSLLIIIILIIGLSWAYKKYGFRYNVSNSPLKIINTMSLGGKEKLFVIQIGNEQILIGVTPGQIRKLHDLQENVEKQKVVKTGSFVRNLNRELHNLEKT